MPKAILLLVSAIIIAISAFAQEARKVRIGDFLGDNYQSFNDIYLTQARDYVACGGAPGRSGHNMWIVLTDREGNEIWNHTFPRNNADLPGEALSIIETDDGDFVAGGSVFHQAGPPLVPPYFAGGENPTSCLIQKAVIVK